jgi:hypothetical protein
MDYTLTRIDPDEPGRYPPVNRQQVADPLEEQVHKNIFFGQARKSSARRGELGGAKIRSGLTTLVCLAVMSKWRLPLPRHTMWRALAPRLSARRHDKRI